MLHPSRVPPPKRKRLRSARGFSLLEVMISSALLLLAIAGTLSGMGTAMRVYEHQRKTSNAINIAESTIEDLLLRFQGDNQTKVSGSEYGPHCYDIDGKFQADASSGTCPTTTYYRATWKSSASSLQGIVNLTVYVRWDETSGTKEINLTTSRN